MEFITKSLNMTKRVMGRSVFFLLMTIAGFSCLEVLVFLARERGWDIVSRFPELNMILGGVTKLAWLEMSVLWIRLMAQPNVDVQSAANDAVETPSPVASAITFGIHTFAWAFRLLLLMKLCELV